MVSDEGVFLSKNKMTKIHSRLLWCLQNGPADKQKIVELVWEYEYDPLRHDPLVYTTVKRLRSALGQYKDWIGSDEQKYYFARGVEVHFGEELSGIVLAGDSLNFEVADPEKDELVRSVQNLEKKHEDLNYRQIATLSKKTKIWSVSLYSEEWDVTTMTALRDLRQMCEAGLIKKTGKGRATRYILIR